ncbi:MAG: hypothetical protein ACKN9T_09485, partial [Candidatus Methylumidiphilus sp.]
VFLGFAELPETVVQRFAAIAKIPYRLGYEINKACKVLGAEALIPLIPQIESGELTRSEVQQMQVPAVSAPPPRSEAGLSNAGKPAAPCGADGKASDSPAAALPVADKKAYVSATGQKLFTYSPASRGWLIRIAPEISASLDETALLALGEWLEGYLRQTGKTRPLD